MRAITVAMDLARVVTRQCEYIIKIYSILIFPLVALLHRSLARSLALCVKGPLDTESDVSRAERETCAERSDMQFYAIVTNACQFTLNIRKIQTPWKTVVLS